MLRENWQEESGIDFSSKESVGAWFAQEFKDWGMIWSELFQTEQCYFIPRPMYHYPMEQHWSTLPNLTMLGDAAHRMPPYAGEGVNMAMLDALQLYECLTDSTFKTTEQAITVYENKMRERAAAITQLTLEQTAVLHQEGALQYLIEMFNGYEQEDTNS